MTYSCHGCYCLPAGTPVKACDTKHHYCHPLNNKKVCQYAFAPEDTLCKHKEKHGHGLYAAVADAELAAAGVESEPASAHIMKSKGNLHSCGVCKAGKCVTESRKWCKKHATSK